MKADWPWNSVPFETSDYVWYLLFCWRAFSTSHSVAVAHGISSFVTGHLNYPSRSSIQHSSPRCKEQTAMLPKSIRTSLTFGFLGAIDLMKWNIAGLLLYVTTFSIVQSSAFHQCSLCFHNPPVFGASMIFMHWQSIESLEWFSVDLIKMENRGDCTVKLERAGLSIKTNAVLMCYQFFLQCNGCWFNPESCT